MTVQKEKSDNMKDQDEKKKGRKDRRRTDRKDIPSNYNIPIYKTKREETYTST